MLTFQFGRQNNDPVLRGQSCQLRLSQRSLHTRSLLLLDFELSAERPAPKNKRSYVQHYRS